MPSAHILHGFKNEMPFRALFLGYFFPKHPFAHCFWGTFFQNTLSRVVSRGLFSKSPFRALFLGGFFPKHPFARCFWGTFFKITLSRVVSGGLLAQEAFPMYREHSLNTDIKKR